jgi:hypothetical protein
MKNNHFYKYSQSFGEDSAYKICQILDYFDLLIPNADEYYRGADGVLIFLNDYGCVLRFEAIDRHATNRSNRVDHPHVLQPVFSRSYPNFVFEICPGVLPFTAAQQRNMHRLHKKLKQILAKDHVDFWDGDSLRNNGLLPLRLPEFPEGIPVVIDRLAVRSFSDMAPLRAALKNRSVIVYEAQKTLYGPIADAFNTAWPVMSSAPRRHELTKAFALLKQETTAGNLIPGWLSEDHRTGVALKSKRYAARLRL